MFFIACMTFMIHMTPRWMGAPPLTLYRVSKNDPPLVCYNFDIHERILIFLGRNIFNVGSQNTLYYATSNNLCFCIIWQNGEHKKSHFFHSNAVLVENAAAVGLCCTHNEKIVICDVFDSVKHFVEMVRYPIHTVHWLSLQAWRRKPRSLHSDRHRDRLG